MGEHTVGHVLDQTPVLGLRPAQRFLRPFALRHVFDLSDAIERRALSTPYDRSAQQNINDRTVLADVTLAELVSGNLSASQLTCQPEICVEIVGMGDGLESESCQLVGTVADDLAERTIDTNEMPIERNQCHPDGRFIDREPKSLLRILQLPFDAL